MTILTSINLSINVYGFKWEYNSERENIEILIIPLRLSNVEGKEFKEENLFYITNNRDELRDQRMINEGEKEFKVISHSFKSQEDLDKHIPCMSTTFDRYPEPGTILNFRNIAKVPLTFIFDFESFFRAY